MAVAKETLPWNEYEQFAEYRRTGDKKIRDQLVNRYIYIAQILSHRFINRGIDYDDIYQVACLGILQAVERFDPGRGVHFATYATPTVMGEIQRYFRDKGNFIKVPRKLYEVFYRAEQVRRSGEPGTRSTEEISRILNIPQKLVEEAYALGDTEFIKSLEYEAYADGALSLAQTLGYEDRQFLTVEDRDFVKYCMQMLKEKEVEFLKLRYVEERSQVEIANAWNVSQMYISRLEKKILKKLRMLYFRD